MAMCDFILKYIGTSFVVSFSFYCWENCLKEVSTPCKVKKYIFIILTTLIITITNIFIAQSIKIITSFILMNVLCHLYYKIEIRHLWL